MRNQEKGAGLSRSMLAQAGWLVVAVSFKVAWSPSDLLILIRAGYIPCLSISTCPKFRI